MVQEHQAPWSGALGSMVQEHWSTMCMSTRQAAPGTMVQEHLVPSAYVQQVL
jgi:hypothetical protein